jgi:HPt (histidine-containing phosphotransfer) domain-containing protein
MTRSLSDIQKELLVTFFAECEECLDQLETGLLSLESSPEDIGSVVDDVFRAAHSIKGGAGGFSFTEIGGLAHCIQKLKPHMRALFSRGVGSKAGLARAGERLRSMITFKQLNLLQGWPMSGPFDVIFCRNVIIYFDTPTKEDLVSRFASLLRPGGFLLLGHSESPAAACTPLLEPSGRTAFVRKANP